MEIILAETAGFCFGVKRAVDTVYQEVEQQTPVYTYGPIIHNEEVVDDLQRRGVKVLHGFDELKQVQEGSVVIRSHGVAKQVYDRIQEQGLKLVDATCPFVLKIHKIVREESEKGNRILIVGSNDHPEVEGIKGWCKTEPIVVEQEEDIDFIDLPPGEKLVIVSQTTFNNKKFQDLVEIISKKGYDICAYNTICNATEARQKETAQIARDADAMIVIGGKNSSNTQKLYAISKQECANTYYIQTLVDLDLTAFESVSRVGITAGASTPNNIIKEVHDSMSELSFEELLQEEEKNSIQIAPGKLVEGEVLSVKPDEIIVNINYKSEGVIPRNEYTNQPNADLTTMVQVGDKISAKVVKNNDGEGQVLLSYKRVAQDMANDRLEAACESGEVLTGKVVQVLEGGLTVLYEESRVFIPASLVSDTYEKNLEKYMDQEVEFVITECNPRKRRVIGNRKMLLVAQKEEAQKALFEKIEVGMTIEGTVKNVTDFGAFIDLGGADGLLHISEMSWGRVENPKKALKVGDTVKAFIKDIQGTKIALSMKFPDQNPWASAAEKYAVGSTVTGKVARMTDFGAFIELEPGVDALLHVSQISKEHIEKPSSVLTVGQEVTAKVVDFKEADKKISLSIKALLPAEEEAEEQTEDTAEETTEE
ncbi:MAG: bifunctional 4-hydroxy-3-methylbut-2-enyl diphosphate reductase/30S ribosomal protein S1 [Bacteroides sp.]|nr:bifunctional 4-hydroxy-3-methylbut-2-enyl diphosphate reductase/30S ribosomal protein S1 [Bacteroides sp.]MCM1550600.1 bifunctional 4-hydroxy-3-methylbut-2-enyl diphosphate reductase/30S ribosomal protein S1 [Clostridium sp.]